MLISDFAIKKPVATVTVMVALVVFGLLALVRLQTDEFPDVQQPVIGLTLIYPGASPQAVEREIVNPVEERLFTISGIDGPRTLASAIDSVAQFTVFFRYEKDIQQAAQDIRDAISAIRGELPAEMKEPILTRFDPGDTPIISLAITSRTHSVAALTRLADPMVVREMRALSGVAQASVVGGVKPEMTVQIRPQALQAAGLSVAELVAALQYQNLAVPVGRINGEFDERTIRLRGRLETPEEFKAVPVAQIAGRAIRLGEVADVFVGTTEARTMALYGSGEAVGIQILKSKGASTTRVVNDVKESLVELRKRLPAGVEMQVVQDSGARVGNAVRNVEEALIEGALLTVLVVFLFLNSWRSTVITGLALPISVLAAFISVWVFGFTLNTMSLLGLTLAIGILIDDAIVVRENIVRHVEMGKDHYTASLEGTNQIGLAVAATTFSIVAVFVPIAFMSGLTGQWFKPFGLTMACAVLVSLFVSFSLDPMLSAYWPDPHVEKSKRRAITRALDRFNEWFDRQADRYKVLVAWALDHRWAMLLLATSTLVAAVVLQGAFSGVELFPVADRSELIISVEAPPGSTLEYTRRKVSEAVAIAKSHPEVDYTFATIGTPLPMRTPGVDAAQVYVKLVPKNTRKLSQNVVGATLRRELSELGGATFAIFTNSLGPPLKQIQLEARAPANSDAGKLLKFAQQVEAEVKQVAGAVDVGLSIRGQTPEIEVELDRQLAGSLGVTAGMVAVSMRPAFAGVRAGDWIDPTGETREVNVRLAPEARTRMSDLASLPLTLGRAPNGVPISLPVRQIASVRQVEGLAQIDHLNREPVVNVQANTSGRPFSDVMRDIYARLDRLPKPVGYTVSEGGESRDLDEVMGAILTALAIALVLMYLILVLQFGSFLDPLAILISIPLSLIGVVIALLLTGDSLNIMSMIGLILLAGIVAKNAILLIDFAKWSRDERGLSLRDALIEAGRVRLRPILMTTMALVAGMTPMALGVGEGADMQAPMGRAVIGGTITSTLLTLVVIPTVYETLDGMKQALIRLMRRISGHAPVPTAGSGGAAEALHQRRED